MNVININLALSGCCPLKANCYQETGNTTNYYPGDCPMYAQCQAVLATLIAFDKNDELEDWDRE